MIHVNVFTIFMQNITKCLGKMCSRKADIRPNYRPNIRPFMAEYSVSADTTFGLIGRTLSVLYPNVFFYTVCVRLEISSEYV